MKRTRPWLGDPMSLTDLVWLATGAYALHILEEYELNWRDWARAVIGLPVEWNDFYVVNAVAIIAGIVAANLAGHTPMLGLAFPALMLINATFFHVAPVLWTRGRFSPGCSRPSCCSTRSASPAIGAPRPTAI